MCARCNSRHAAQLRSALCFSREHMRNACLPTKHTDTPMYSCSIIYTVAKTHTHKHIRADGEHTRHHTRKTTLQKPSTKIHPSAQTHARIPAAAQLWPDLNKMVAILRRARFAILRVCTLAIASCGAPRNGSDFAFRSALMLHTQTRDNGAARVMHEGQISGDQVNRKSACVVSLVCMHLWGTNL